MQLHDQENVYYSATPPTLLTTAGLKYYYFCYKGRLNRKRFILGQILLSALFVPLLISFATGLDEFFMTSASPNSYHLPKPLAKHTFKEGAGALGIFMLFAALGYILMIHALIVKRFHDMNKSGHYSWFLFLPVISVFFSILLYFKRGTRGDNTYGPDPLSSHYYAHPHRASKKKKSARDPQNPDGSDDSPPVVRRS